MCAMSAGSAKIPGAIKTKRYDDQKSCSKPSWLVVSTYPSEKYEFVSWGDEIPNIWKVIKFHGSKPPSSKPLNQVLRELFGVTNCPFLSDHPDGLRHHQYSIVYGWKQSTLVNTQPDYIHVYIYTLYMQYIMKVWLENKDTCVFFVSTCQTNLKTQPDDNIYPQSPIKSP